ncbi:uncharacterized protein si:dkey-23k10.2 [Megalobrama amblycephala]|uniref:uncharacterized protein si:dkey-23k10.2 n=1 Tax=Megalobrama amblycephala TaxID=75352 RepID=UPI002013FA2E|nr:uncharacterized protein si:dkey-23k10.2 [Megalobrama amblycephala]
MEPDRPESPEPSCGSLKRCWSSKHGSCFKDNGSMQVEKPYSSAPSCVSINSGQSIEHPVFFKDGDTSEHGNDCQHAEVCKMLQSHVRKRGQSLDRRNPTLHEISTECSSDCQNAEVRIKLKSDLKTKSQCFHEGIEKQGTPTFLNEIYTELYITEGGGGEINNEHEISWVEKASRKASAEDTPIKLNDVFKPLHGQNQPIRTVLTKGVAGIGKTVSVQKFILDWAEGKANQDVHLIFPLPFRELNLLKDQTFSLKGLLEFFMGTKQLEISPNECKIIFIFDGLDECRLSLDFQNNMRLCDVTESASVDVLLTNLIVGNLLPSALIWITSRPAATDLIPSECVDRLTDVRGFNDPQKEEYFKKRIRDQSLANQIISHLKSSRSLYIMCHIPVFCWISATVLEKMLNGEESGEIPKTLTQMYTHFLILQTNIKHEKDYEKKLTDEDMIFKLGKLAFQELMKHSVIFYEEDLRECGIDVTEASVYSGLCTQIFREEFGLCQRKVYCFVHLSIQEHLAALYVLFSFSLKNVDVLSEYQALKYNVQSPACFTIYERAVEEALQSKNGHLDLFLRFLLGLSLESNQTLFKCLLKQTGGMAHNTEEIIQYVKKKIRENLYPDKSINLFHCLNELGDHILENEIQEYLSSGTIRDAILSPSQWSALVFVLLTSEQLEEFELKEYIRDEFNQINITQDQVLHNLLPVVEASRSAQLGCCSLSENCCTDLASVLGSEFSCLRELNLNFNHLKSSGVKLLCAGLQSPHCKLEALWLWRCDITDEGCAALAFALNSNPSHLRELDLSENNLGDQGMKLFSDALKSSQCKLETLKLRLCNLSNEGCAALTSALRSNPSHLRELDLSENELGDAGVQFLSDGLGNPLCNLEILWLRECDITDEGCATLALALTSNPSHMKELDLTNNKLTETGTDMLTAIKFNPHYKLEKLHNHSMDQLEVKKTLLEPSSVQMGRSASPTPSHESMRSDLSMNKPLDLKESSSVQMGRSSPCPSHESMRSDLSMNKPLDLRESSSVQMGRSSPCPSHESMRSDLSMNKPLDLKESSNASPLDKIRDAFQSNLRSIFQCVHEGKSTNSAPIPLNEIYTELYITEGGSGEINNEHDIRWIETAFRRGTTEDTQINLNDVFKTLLGQNQPIRTVLTKGVAGIGKTLSVQKFILDWAEGKANQDVDLIFPLPFRELNLLKNQTFSLIDLIKILDLKHLEISLNESKIIFIFDGLDECRLSLDFQNNVRLCDVTESASVDVLLTNLIVGNLLPSALIWITSRPAATDLVPSECVDRVTEVRGFSDPQKEEYFRKRIGDQSLANKIISHLKSSRSLYIMCHIPVFCWISATVLEKMLSEAESGEIPKTLTQMYTHFLILQTNIKHEKDYEKKLKAEDMILKLGKLAFQQLEKQNLIFYEEDLRKFGIDEQEAAVYSGLCTQIFREESGLFQGKVYSFVHLSVQEHLAALYVYLSFVNQKTNELDQPGFLLKFLPCAAQSSIFDLYQRAVKKALQSTSGHLDLFLRFLLGMSMESNQTLLQGLLSQTESSSDNKERIVMFIKGKIKENPPTEKLINLFHCLNELNDHSLVEEIQHYLKSGSRINTTLTASQWSAMVFVLLTSGQKLDVFDLNKYIGTHVLSDECLQRLQPVLEAARTAMLCEHNLTRKGCTTLVSVLTSKTSCLKELNLARSNLNDSELKLLCAGLGNGLCQLERLGLEFCGISDKGCTSLALALSSNPSQLKELDLSGNKFSDSGLKILSAELQNPHCKLEKLWMRLCDITDEGCASMALLLKSNPSHLRGLNLSGNKLGDLGMKDLVDGLENPHCKLEILRLRDCGITHEGCAALASALRSNPSHLKELDLSGNKLKNIGVKKLSAELENSDCNLEMLRLNNCDVTSEGCAALAEALKSNPLSLRELDLGWNKLGDSGVQPLFAALENPNCKLQVLRLRDCNIAEEGCDALASTLKSNPSHLRELDLSQNKLRTLWVKMLCTALEKPDCNLEMLRLEYCGLTDKSCAVLESALRSNPSHLRELDLYMNNLGDSGRQLLSALKDDPNFSLQKLQY